MCSGAYVSMSSSPCPLRALLFLCRCTCFFHHHCTSPSRAVTHLRLDRGTHSTCTCHASSRLAPQRQLSLPRSHTPTWAGLPRNRPWAWHGEELPYLGLAAPRWPACVPGQPTRAAAHARTLRACMERAAWRPVQVCMHACLSFSSLQTICARLRRLHPPWGRLLGCVTQHCRQGGVPVNGRICALSRPHAHCFTSFECFAVRALNAPPKRPARSAALSTPHRCVAAQQADTPACRLGLAGSHVDVDTSHS